MIPGESFPLLAWIASNRDLLQPPTGGKTVLAGGDFMITVVGGPNARTDYHVNPFEEFYLQLEGEMTLRIQREGRPHDISIAGGSAYLLPPLVPHAPQRPAGTVGVILERRRNRTDIDAHEWYCEQCNALLFRKEAFIEVVERDMPAVFDAYYADASHQRCKACGHVNSGRPARATPQ